MGGQFKRVQVPPADAAKVKWALTPKGAVVSNIMHAVNAAAAEDANITMVPLSFSPDLPLTPSLAGTNMLTGWAFVRPPAPTETNSKASTLDRAVLLHLGRNETVVDLSPLLALGEVRGRGDMALNGDAAVGRWEMTAQFQPGGPAALLQNMSSVVRQVLPISSSNRVRVPPYAVLRLEKV